LISEAALSAKLKSSDVTLLEKLISEGAVEPLEQREFVKAITSP
jgi:hypothetical protein